jgi:hypothetical protein
VQPQVGQEPKVQESLSPRPGLGQRPKVDRETPAKSSVPPGGVQRDSLLDVPCPLLRCPIIISQINPVPSSFCMGVLGPWGHQTRDFTPCLGLHGPG